jgi:hypothetical protein
VSEPLLFCPIPSNFSAQTLAYGESVSVESSPALFVFRDVHDGYIRDVLSDTRRTTRLILHLNNSANRKLG